jgi:hydroxymethylglutaryl-CoA lyase
MPKGRIYPAAIPGKAYLCGMNRVYITECPRDAMQGLHDFIPTEVKVAYLQTLLSAGFDTLDFGSFVSPKAIPQMADTAQVLEQLDLSQTNTQLLAIVANVRGAQDACGFDHIRFLGYPFSISETFQQRNTNASIDESLLRVEEIQQLCAKHGKEPLIYISMAFGNPYGDAWAPEIAAVWTERLHRELEIKHIALADTIGVSDPANITALFSELIPAFPGCTIGAHLHTTPLTWREKVDAAYQAGCRYFDGALKGFGGCPMAKDDLTGNMPTELMLDYFDEAGAQHGVNSTILAEALRQTNQVFPL